MKNFETHCVKFEDHNCAIENNKLNIGPTVRIIDNNAYQLGFTLHKWELQPTGKALAIYVFDKHISFNDSFWKNPKDSHLFTEFNENINKISEKLHSFQLLNLIEKIENNELEFIKTFKYHANQWREIEKKKTKWVYKEKQIKTDICNIQRLLK